MKEFKFNTYSNFDFNLRIVKINIGSPKLITNNLSVPYSNGTYDFSKVGTGGLSTYQNRKISIDVNYFGENITDMYVLYSKISTSILGYSSNLEFNYITGYYKARCISISDLDTFKNFSKMTITFDCQPFLYQGNYGNDIWDTFNFEKDISEINSYVIKSNDILSIYNPGINVRPTISVSNDTIIFCNNIEFKLNQGFNQIFGLNFYTGFNEIKILNASENTQLSVYFDKNLI